MPVSINSYLRHRTNKYSIRRQVEVFQQTDLAGARLEIARSKRGWQSFRRESRILSFSVPLVPVRKHTEKRAGTQEIRRGCRWKVRGGKQRKGARERVEKHLVLVISSRLWDTIRVWTRRSCAPLATSTFPFSFLAALFVSGPLLLRPRPLLVPKKQRAIEARRPRTRSARVMYEKRLFISSRGGVRYRGVELRVGKGRKRTEGDRERKKDRQRRTNPKRERGCTGQAHSVPWTSKKQTSSDILWSCR